MHNRRPITGTVPADWLPAEPAKNPDRGPAMCIGHAVASIGTVALVWLVWLLAYALAPLFGL